MYNRKEAETLVPRVLILKTRFSSDLHDISTLRYVKYLSYMYLTYTLNVNTVGKDYPVRRKRVLTLPKEYLKST